MGGANNTSQKKKKKLITKFYTWLPKWWALENTVTNLRVIHKREIS